MQASSTLQHRIEARLNARRQQHLHRSVFAFQRDQSALFDANGNEFINFSGNDYLGLSQEPLLIAAWQEGLSRFGAGSSASPLVTGYSLPHQRLENALCDWLGFERAMLFNSGFSANQAVIFSLLEKGDLLVQDKLNHASLIEAGMLSPATMKRFPHNNDAKLNDTLSGFSGAALVVTEGVFSMDGDLAPLDTIRTVCDQHNAWLMVDDAHGCGVLGKDGRGSCDVAGIQPDILIVTFGKAFGMNGAAVLCSKSMHDYLVQFARHYVYSTAMPPAQAYALENAVELIRTQGWRREKLTELSEHFHQALGDFAQVKPSVTPIKPVILGDVSAMNDAAAHLKEKGLWTGAIRPPTVPANTARLRITLSSSHSIEQLTRLTEALKPVLENAV